MKANYLIKNCVESFCLAYINYLFIVTNNFCLWPITVLPVYHLFIFTQTFSITCGCSFAVVKHVFIIRGYVFSLRSVRKATFCNEILKVA